MHDVFETTAKFNVWTKRVSCSLGFPASFGHCHCGHQNALLYMHKPAYASAAFVLQCRARKPHCRRLVPAPHCFAAALQVIITATARCSRVLHCSVGRQAVAVIIGSLLLRSCPAGHMHCCSRADSVLQCGPPSGRQAVLIASLLCRVGLHRYSST